VNLVVWLESFHIAFREMSRHRMRSFLTMLGVIIGVAAIITVVAIMEGARHTIQGQIARVGSNMILVIPGSVSLGGVRAGSGSASSLTMDDAAAIDRECPAVAYSSPVTNSKLQAVSEWGNWSLNVQGIGPEYFDVRAWKVEAGRRIEARDVDAAAKVCLIGRTAARQLFGHVDPIGLRVRVGGTPMQVVGTLAEKGQNPLGVDEDDTLLVPITTYFRHLSGRSRPDAIVLSTEREADIPQAVEQVTALLRDRHQLTRSEANDFAIKPLAEAAKTAEETGSVLTALLVCIAGISLLVGGIGIMNIMLVTVMERTREIGIRMAIGATRRMIMHQFMIEAASLAGFGGLLGVLAGIAGGSVLSRITGWPAIFSPGLLVTPMVFAIAVGMLFGLLPARRASRLSPVESLRHD